MSENPQNQEVQPMEDAPQDGEVIEALYEGDWIKVFWSSRADDGSPYGVEGWADHESGHCMLDLEGWREDPSGAYVDEVQQDLDRIEAHEATERERKRRNRKKPRPRAIVKAELEARHLELFGEDISGTKYSIPDVRQKIVVEANRLRRINTAKELGSIMRGFGF